MDLYVIVKMTHGVLVVGMLEKKLTLLQQDQDAKRRLLLHDKKL